MECPPRRLRKRGIQRGPEQRMCEVDPIAADDTNDARRFGGAERGEVDVFRGRARPRRHLGQGIAGGARQSSDPEKGEVATTQWHGKRMPGCNGSQSLDFAGDLQRIERVSTGRLVDADEHRACHRLAEDSENHRVQCPHAERTNAYALQAIPAQSVLERGHDREALFRQAFDSDRHQQAHVSIVQTAQGKCQSNCRRRIEPLRVVNGHN